MIKEYNVQINRNKIIIKNVPEKKRKKEKWTEMRHASNILLCRSSTASEAVGLARSTYHYLSIVSFGRSNVFTPVCQSFFSPRGCVSYCMLGYTPPRQTPIWVDPQPFVYYRMRQ